MADIESIRSKTPSLRFLFSHPAHLVACGFGSGLSPLAPGTAGTLFAWASFPLLRGMLTDSGLLAFLLVSCFVGISVVQRTGDDLGEIDHRSIVWDEIVPFWLTLFFCPPGWTWQAAAFLAFRFFDIVKPQPARFFDERVKNGFGVMADDLVASAYTVATLTIGRYFLTGFSP
jgi:phosphatidylglycerophosphatase A